MADLASWVVEVVERFGYPGVAVLIALENVVPPIPSEIILPMAGFAVSQGSLRLPLVVLAATVGSVMGALVLYELGRRVGEPRMRHFVERHGRWLLLSAEDVDRSSLWFERHGAWAVLLGRLAPGVRSLVSLPAGVAGMAMPQFLALTVIGSALWNTLLVWLGYELGERWTLVAGYVDRGGTAVWGVLVALLAVVVVRRVVTQRRRRTQRTR